MQIITGESLFCQNMHFEKQKSLQATKGSLIKKTQQEMDNRVFHWLSIGEHLAQSL